MSSSFDKDFGRRFEPVEETMVLGDLASRLTERYPPDAPEIAKEHRLRIVDPTGDEWEYPVRGEVMIGRAPDNHITLNDRAVSRHHLALNTDGSLYWFQDMNSGNGTQVNGEFMQEGWLVGAEEIVVGNSRLYFLLPETDATPAPGESVSAGLSLSASLDRVPQVDEPLSGIPNVSAPTEIPGTPDSGASGTSWLLGFVFFVGLLCAGVAGLWLYRKHQKPKDIEKPIVRAISPKEKATTLLEQAELFLKQKKWLEADKMFRQALTLLPDKSALRMTIAARAQEATRELQAIENLEKAKNLYHYRFKIKAALQHLDKISAKTDIYAQASALRNLIRRKELDTQLSMAGLLMEANKKDDAIAKVKSVLAMDPNYDAAQSLLKKLSSQPVADVPVAPIDPKPTKPRRRARSVGAVSLQQGLGYYRNGDFTQAIIFFRRQESAGASRRDRQRAGQYRRYVQSYQSGWSQGVRAVQSSNWSRAVTLLSQAYQADQSLGSVFSSQIGMRLSQALYQRGKQYQNRGNYAQAAQDYKKATTYHAKNSQAHVALQSLRQKAKSLLEEGEVLIGVSNNDARTKIRQAQGLLSTTDPLYRKASQLLSRAQ